jgi:hypothetical protein
VPLDERTLVRERGQRPQLALLDPLALRYLERWLRDRRQ